VKGFYGKFEKTDLANNHLVELNKDCTYSITKLVKNIKVERIPKAGFDNIF
jgi:hypothetical protein